jgi:conjugative relaxase-like TrwC/TraI family protein
MLSISEAIKGVNDAVNYHIHEGKEAYYLAGIGQEGRWLGGAVEPLKLPDTVTAKAFRNLLHGYSPDGHKPLVQNAGHPDRDAGWDLTFSVPKAVSVLWAMSPPAVRAEIEASQRHAVKIALGQAEEIFGFTRRGQGGKRHEHAALLFANFEEYTSRAQDMQIHTHCVLINTSVRQDGTTGALHSINFFRAKLLLGAVHETELARQLQERLHVGIEPQTVGFGLAGLPESVCRHFSKRHTAIQQAMAERHVSGPVAAKVVTRETRPRKEHVPAGRLFQSWHEQGRSQGWGPEQAAKLVQVQHAMVAKPLEPALRTKLAGLAHEQQTRKRLIKLARVTALQQGAGGQELLASLERLHLPAGQTILWRPHPANKDKGEGQTPARTPRSHSQEHAANRPDQPVTSRPQARTEPLPVAPPAPDQPTQPPAPEPATRSPMPPRPQPSPSRSADRPSAEVPAEPPPEAVPDRPLPQAAARQEPASAGPSRPAPENKSDPTRSPEGAARQTTQRPPSAARSTPANAHGASPKSRDPEAAANRAQPAPEHGARQTSSPPPPGQTAAPGTAANQRKRPEASSSGQQQRQQASPGGTAEPGRAADESRSEQAHGRPAGSRRTPRKQRVRNRMFERTFGAAVDRIFPAKQTRQRLTRLAKKLAQEHGADEPTFQRVLRDMRPGAERAYLHVERPRLFPHSPIPALKWLRVPKLALGDKPIKWGDIRWKQNVIIGELRIQQRHLFPSAGRRSSLHNLALPALHFSFKKSKWQPRKQSPKRAQQNVQQPRTAGRPSPSSSQKDQRQDHSQSP